MRKIMSCGVLIVRGDPIKEFLLMEHPTRLDLPKGHVDEGETELQCAMRELAEETGIRPKDVELDPDFRFTYKYNVWPKRFNGEKCRKTLVIYLGRLIRDVDITVTEHQGYRWFKWDPPHRIQAETIDPLLSKLADSLR